MKSGQFLKTLRSCIEMGPFDRMAPFYTEASVLEVHLPTEPKASRGRDEILDQLAFARPDGRPPSAWQVNGYPEGFWLTLQYETTATAPATGQLHLIHMSGGVVGRHIVYPVKGSGPLPPPTAVRDGRVRSLLERAVRRTPLSGGLAGSALERIELDDGTPLVVKHISSQSDWIMRATNDRGRAALLWTRGVMNRFPSQVDHAMVDAAPTDDGWLLIMKDVSSTLNRPIALDDVIHLIRCVHHLHCEFEGRSIENLCALEDRLNLFSPTTAERERDGYDLAPKIVGRGWELFEQIAPRDVVELLVALRTDPSTLATRLGAIGTTLVHGDLRPGNFGRTRAGVTMIDWSLAAFAPAAFEVAWLCFNLGASTSLPLEPVLHAYREIAGAHYVEEAWALAVVATLLQSASYFGFQIKEHPDPVQRQAARQYLAWWIKRTRWALDLLGEIR